MKDWGKPKDLKYKGKYVYNWFSNFEKAPMQIDGKTWNTVEAYFQAMKTLDMHKQKEIRLSSPGEAKYLGRRVQLRKDWEEIKETIMFKGLKAKWSLPKWKKLLLATGNEDIIEWNNWGDRVWGVTLDGRGHNKLGILLMKLRKEFKNEEAI